MRCRVRYGRVCVQHWLSFQRKMTRATHIAVCGARWLDHPPPTCKGAWSRQNSESFWLPARLF
jgi:hypothetical protein